MSILSGNYLFFDNLRSSLAERLNLDQDIELQFSPIEVSVLRGKRYLKTLDILSCVLDLVNRNILTIEFSNNMFNLRYDEETMQQALAARREKYLQFADVLPGAIPELVGDPQELRATFASSLRKSPYENGPFGFDAEWEEDAKSGAIVLGYGSLYNHSYAPNARYYTTFDTRTLDIVALKDIPIGEEITVNYNGEPEDQSAVWFLEEE